MSRRQECVYGFPCVEDPNNFHPDGECCSPEELAAHKLACDTYGTPPYQPNKGCTTEFDAEGKLVKHILRTSWGIGINTFEIEDCDECHAEGHLTTCWDCNRDYCDMCWPKHDAKEACE